jgi:hypothetical protein
MIGIFLVKNILKKLYFPKYLNTKFTKKIIHTESTKDLKKFTNPLRSLCKSLGVLGV